jgi:hypothetical protein
VQDKRLLVKKVERMTYRICMWCLTSWMIFKGEGKEESLRERDG